MDLIHSDVLTHFLVESHENKGDEDEEEGSLPSREDYLGKLLSLTQNAVKQANSIPTGTGYSIKASNPQYSQKASAVSASIASELFDILSTICPSEFLITPITTTTPDSLSKNYEKFVDCMEYLLSKVDKGISVCSSKHPDILMNTILTSEKKDGRQENNTVVSLICNEAVSKDVSVTTSPQLDTHSARSPKLLFGEGIQSSYWNSRGVDCGRFVPSLTFKPHGLTPLPQIFHEAQLQVLNLEMMRGVTAPVIASLPTLPHPYADEIRSLDWENVSTAAGESRMFKLCKPTLYYPLDKTPLVWIRTTSELKEMIDEIKSDVNCHEIAIDLEHHSRYSYRGITCLIQMSTRMKDYIIDPVNLKEELVNLNEITANPHIVKVFHGSDSDILWLQRDFSVYVVNLFDTGQAARLIGVSGGASLANILMYYCKVCWSH